MSTSVKAPVQSSRLKQIVLWILGLFVIAVVVIIAIVAVILNYDWDHARPWINAKVSQAIGREFAITGHLSLNWKHPPNEHSWRAYVPWPSFTAENIHITNPSWAKRPYLATLDSIHFDVAALPLLHRNIVIPIITLSHPSIDLERLHDGRVNWNLSFAPSSSSWKVELHEMTFSPGQIQFSDQIKKVDIRSTVTPLGRPIRIDALEQAAHAPEAKQAKLPQTKVEPYAFGLTLDGTFNKAPIYGSGKIGGVLSLAGIRQQFPIQLDVRIGDNNIAFEGTLNDPAQLAALDLQLHLSATSMSHLYEVTGLVLPETPPFKTHGHLTGHLNKSGNRFKYEHFSGQVGSSDLSGTLEYISKLPRPLLNGTVVSTKLVFSDLAPIIGADSNRKKAIRGAPPQKTNKAIPEERFYTERWKSMDVDVKFTGDRIIRKAALPISDMFTHLILKDGVLTLNPLKFGVAGGALSGNIHLNGSTDPLKGRFDISARHLMLKQLFPTFELMRTSLGQINGDAELSATGNSPAALAATSNGEVKLLLSEGAISSTLLEEAGLNVANIVIAKLFGDERVKINCAAADFIVKQGVLDSRVFALDTEDALINVNGTINLSNEQMNLHVYPNTKGLRIFSLRSPLYVRGTFKKPDVGVEMNRLLARGGGAIGLGLINPFAALLALIVPSNNEKSPCPGIIAEANKGLKHVPTPKTPEARKKR